MQSPDTLDTKASFRKPLNDVAHRKYRHRSSANGSSLSDRSPKRDHSSSPIFSREDPAKVSELQQRRKDDERELDSDCGLRHHGRGGNSYRHSDKQSSGNSHGYSKHDDYVKQDKYANAEDRDYQRLSSRSGRESNASTHSDYAKQETKHCSSKDYLSCADKSLRDGYVVPGRRNKDKEKESYLERQKYKDKDSSSDRAGSGRRSSDRAGSGRRLTISNSEEMGRDWHNKRDRDGRDEKRDYHRSSGDYRNYRSVMCEESRVHRDESSGKDYDGHRLKEAYRNDPKELDGQKLAKEEKKRYDDNETTRDEDRYYRDKKPDFVTEKQETPTKKQKVSNWDKGADYAVKKTSSSSVQAQDTGVIGAFVQAHASASVANDLDVAKVAAMKAAELVNNSLIGVGYMSADQKKKLLWGSKKSTTSEEPGHQWDAALLGDRDRQEKFNKLMGVKGEVKVEHKPNNQDGSGLLQAEKQRELQLDLEKQYTAGLRRRDGRTVGLGL